MTSEFSKETFEAFFYDPNYIKLHEYAVTSGVLRGETKTFRADLSRTIADAAVVDGLVALSQEKEPEARTKLVRQLMTTSTNPLLAPAMSSLIRMLRRAEVSIAKVAPMIEAQFGGEMEIEVDGNIDDTKTYPALMVFCQPKGKSGVKVSLSGLSAAQAAAAIPYEVSGGGGGGGDAPAPAPLPGGGGGGDGGGGGGGGGGGVVITGDGISVGGSGSDGDSDSDSDDAIIRALRKLFAGGSPVQQAGMINTTLGWATAGAMLGAAAGITAGFVVGSAVLAAGYILMAPGTITATAVVLTLAPLVIGGGLIGGAFGGGLGGSYGAGQASGVMLNPDGKGDVVLGGWPSGLPRLPGMPDLEV